MRELYKKISQWWAPRKKKSPGKDTQDVCEYSRSDSSSSESLSDLMDDAASALSDGDLKHALQQMFPREPCRSPVLTSGLTDEFADMALASPSGTAPSQASENVGPTIVEISDSPVKPSPKPFKQPVFGDPSRAERLKRMQFLQMLGSRCSCGVIRESR